MTKIQNNKSLSSSGRSVKGPSSTPRGNRHIPVSFISEARCQRLIDSSVRLGSDSLNCLLHCLDEQRPARGTSWEICVQCIDLLVLCVYGAINDLFLSCMLILSLCNITVHALCTRVCMRPCNACTPGCQRLLFFLPFSVSCPSRNTHTHTHEKHRRRNRQRDRETHTEP